MSTEAIQPFLYPVTVEGAVQLRRALAECDKYQGLSADRKAIIFVDFHQGPAKRGVIEITPKDVSYYTNNEAFADELIRSAEVQKNATKHLGQENPQNSYAEYRYKILSDKIKDAPFDSPARRLLEIEKKYMDILSDKSSKSSPRQEQERMAKGYQYTNDQLKKIVELQEEFLAIAEQAKHDDWVKYIVGHSDLLDERESSELSNERERLKGSDPHSIPIAPYRRKMIDVYRSEPDKDSVFVLEQLIGIGKKYHFNPFTLEDDKYGIRKMAEECSVETRREFLERHPRFLDRNREYDNVEIFPKRPKGSPRRMLPPTPAPSPSIETNDLIPVEEKTSQPKKSPYRITIFRDLNLDSTTEVGSKNVRYGIGTLIGIGVFVAVSVGLFPILGPSSFGIGFGAAILFIVVYTWANKLYEKNKANKRPRIVSDESKPPKRRRRKPGNSLEKVVTLEPGSIPLEKPVSAAQKQSENRQDYIKRYQSIRAVYKRSGTMAVLVLLQELFEKIKMDYFAQYKRDLPLVEINAVLREVIETLGISYIDFQLIEFLHHNKLAVEEGKMTVAATALDNVTENILGIALRKVAAELNHNKNALQAYIDKQSDPYYKLYFVEQLLSKYPDSEIRGVGRKVFASVIQKLDPNDPVVMAFLHRQALVTFSHLSHSTAVDRFMLGVRNIPIDIVIQFIKQHPESALSFFNDPEFKLRFANIIVKQGLSSLMPNVVASQESQDKIRYAIHASEIMQTGARDEIRPMLEKEFRKKMQQVINMGVNGLATVFALAHFRDELLSYITPDNGEWIRELLIEKSTTEFKYFLLKSGFLERLDDQNYLKHILIESLRNVEEIKTDKFNYIKMKSVFAREFLEKIRQVIHYGVNDLNAVFASNQFQNELLLYIAPENAYWVQELFVERSSIQFKYILLKSRILERLDETNPLKEKLLADLNNAIQTHHDELNYVMDSVTEENSDEVLSYAEFARAIENVLEPEKAMQDKHISELVEHVVMYPESGIAEMMFAKKTGVRLFSSQRNYVKELWGNPDLIKRLILEGSDKVRALIVTSNLLNAKEANSNHQEYFRMLLNPELAIKITIQSENNNPVVYNVERFKELCKNFEYCQAVVRSKFLDNLSPEVSWPLRVALEEANQERKSPKI